MKRGFALLGIGLLLGMGPVFSQTGQDPRQNSARPDALRSYRIGRDLEAQNRTDEANQYYNEAVKICLDELHPTATNMDS
jgi:hypothetical protein